MYKTGPNPLNGYRYDTKEVPVETSESMVQEVLESTKTGTDYDKKQNVNINKNASNIKSANEKIKDLEKHDKDVYTKEEIDEAFEEVGASVVYDKEAKTISLLNVDGEVLGEPIDCSDFLKDGMIESVEIVDGNLVITFNTESGKETITIPLSQIFNPDNYYTKAEVDALLEGNATQEWVNEQGFLKEHQSLDGYATENWVNEQGFLKEHQSLDGYATENWVNEQGFLKEHQSLDGYATENWVNEQGFLKEHQSLDGYATENWVNEQGFLKEHQSLDNYYNKSEVDEKDAELAGSISDEVARAQAEENKKVDKEILGPNGKALIFNETDGGGAKFEHSDGTWSFTGVNDGGENGLVAQIYGLKKNQETGKFIGTRINVYSDKIYYLSKENNLAGVPGNDASVEIAVKKDIPSLDGFATQEWVNDQNFLTEHQSLDGVGASISYDSNSKEITLKNENGDVLGQPIDASDFVKDGMVENVAIVDGNLVITFNTEAGKENISIPVSEIFNPDEYYTKEDVDGLMVVKEKEIYELKKSIGDIGGAVTYDMPNGANISLNGLMSSYSGTIKLGEDVTSTRVGPGMMAKNTVKLNLNTHNLTCTNADSYGAIMARGSQNYTIYGKGTIDSDSGICINANGENVVINLTGSTTEYHNNRSGGELIYCYAGTINITNGIFKNDGENKGFMLNCYDANYRAGKANIIVTGGKFYGFNPADNSAEGEHTSFVPEGYTVTESMDGDIVVYTVKKV